MSVRFKVSSSWNNCQFESKMLIVCLLKLKMFAQGKLVLLIVDFKYLSCENKEIVQSDVFALW